MTTKTDVQTIGHAIVVIQAGWVAIGEVTRHRDLGITKITDAKIIRTWGTTKGLGQIALEGPTSETILDESGVIEVYDHAVIMTFKCTYRDKE